MAVTSEAGMTVDCVEMLATLRPYITHQISCPWLTWMGVNRTAAQQRKDCRCGFFEVVPAILRAAKRLQGA